jgi:FAD/FMN-containing dehydrogenases
MSEQIAALTDIVGASNIYGSPEILDIYAKDESFVMPMKPASVVKVNNAQEVQKIVQWANQTNTPLIPVSSGGPHFRGDTVPSVPEAIIVDLSGMKKIEFNRVHRIAYVEPGVTYGELQAALAKEGMRLPTALAPRATKSVIASVLEVEPRLNPHTQWNYAEPLRCLEVVWGDGNKMFTGSAANGPADLEKQRANDCWQHFAYGPGQVDYFRFVTQAQGSMGIVTWASLRCELLPQIHNLHFVPAEKEADLIDFVYRILKLRFADEFLILDAAYLASLLGENADQIKELKSLLPSWVILVAVAGRSSILPEERVYAQTQDIAEIAQQFGLKFLPSVPGANGAKVLETILNPSKEPYFKQRAKGASQDLFFVTTLDKTPKFIAAMNVLAEEAGVSPNDIGVYIQPQHAGTSVHCEFSLPYDPANSREVAQIKKLYAKASQEFCDAGAFFARPYGIWSKIQFNKDAQATITLKKNQGNIRS